MRSLLFVGLCLPALAQAPLLEALKTGKVTLEVRTRYEHTEDSDYKAPADHKTANALTNRTLLGFETGKLWDASLTLQAANVAALGEERYNSGLNNKTQFATVQDPTQTELLQAYVGWKGFKAGRQVLSVDNQRFIGPGAWSQMPKAFTGLTYQGSIGLPDVEAFAGHLTRLTSSLGVNKNLRATFGRLRWKAMDALAITPYWYGVNETTAPKTSYQHRGLRVDGTWKGLVYEAAYAQQRGYKESVTTPDRQYRQIALGYTWDKKATVKGVHEVLEGGFATPLSSLHGFYGWSDRIGATPADGLKDTYLQGEAKAWGFTFEVQIHQFKAFRTSQAYGKEVDFSATYPVTKAFAVMLKAADYKGDSAAPGNLAKDLRKLWLMTTFKF